MVDVPYLIVFNSFMSLWFLPYEYLSWKMKIFSENIKNKRGMRLHPSLSVSF